MAGEDKLKEDNIQEDNIQEDDLQSDKVQSDHVQVVLIGGIHHNGLNLARMLGEHGVIADALVVGKGDNFLKRSRFVKNSICFDKEKDAFDYILKNYDPNKQKCMLFPFSDGAAYELDQRLNEFQSYIVPSIHGKQGAIAHLMNKEVQYEYAKRHDIRMPVSLTFHLKTDNTDRIDFFPVIVKPVISAKGDKGDIRVCYQREKFEEAIHLFKEHDYEICLVQQYLEIDYEILIVGAIYKNKTECDFAAHKVVRQWPPRTGSGSYDVMIEDPEILKECRRILDTIRDTGYDGLIDVEAFMVGGKVYLNEINWRNSGGGYRAMSTGFHYPYWYYQDALGKSFEPVYDRSKTITSMLELWDFNNVMADIISLSDWLRQYKKVDNFALKYPGDMEPVKKLRLKWKIKCIGKLILKMLHLVHYENK